jgi:Bifunctional DNA primase/polymerase, N-terminal
VPEIPLDAGVLSAALTYAAAGWCVVPVLRGTKNPGSRLGTGWPALSSRDPEQIAAWFAGTDDGIALHTRPSGTVVFDVDHPEKLPEALKRAETEADPPTQLTRDDQRRHLVFAVPPGRHLGNSTGGLGRGWGEVRGGNGVIMVAPSEHPDGGRYRWTRTGAVPVLPDYVAEQLPDAGPGEDAADPATVEAFARDHATGDGTAALSGPLTRFRREVDAGSSRHEAMVTAACWAAREVHAGAYAAADAMAGLREEFVTALAQARDGQRLVDPAQARAEFARIWAWAVSQALAEGREACRARLDRNRLDERKIERAPAGEDGGTNLPVEFWEARPVLRHIRAAAQCRFTSPDAVLGAVLARESAYAHPRNGVDLGLGGSSPLTVFSILLGPPAAGKGRSLRCAADILPVPGWLVGFQQRSLGSGEGMVEAYYGLVLPPPGPDGKPGKGGKVHKQIRANVLFVHDEGEALVKIITGRSGTTIAQTIRSAWSGESIGQANASAERDRQLDEGGYSIGLVVAFQPDTIGPLFDPTQVGGGTPHRFLFVSALDPAAPDDPSPWPGPLVVPEPHDPELVRQRSPGTPTRYVLTDEKVRAEIQATRRAVLRGQVEIPEQDTHATLLRGRVAAHLARWDGRTNITGEDWRLAGMVVATSGRLRDSAIEHGQARAARDAEVRKRSHVDRQVAASVATADAIERRTEQRVARGAAVLARKVRDADPKGLTRRAMKDAAGRYRDVFDAALGNAESRGWITSYRGGRGLRYRPGPNVGDVPAS